MKVRLFYTLKEIVGRDEVELEFENSISVANLLNLLIKRYGKGFKEYICGENGEVKTFLGFLVNGKSITSLKGFETKLKDGDTLTILPPLGGG